MHQLFALGTEWWLELAGGDEAAALNAITERIRRFEADYSRFNHESLIGQLNNTHNLHQPPSELVAMLHYGLQVYRHTDGIFNISIGAELEKHGYGLQRQADHYVSNDLTQDIIISDTNITTAPQVILDLGGFGKGWLVDVAASIAREFGCNHIVINGGGDIAVRTPAPITCVVEHPFDSTLSIATVELSDGGFASSSSRKRRWQHNNQTKHHLIHPATTQPTAHAASSHVIAASALLADTYASVILLCTPEQRAALAKTIPFEYLLVYEDGSYIANSQRFNMNQ